MQVKDILDYFGPRLECRTKFHRVGETKILFETEGFDIMEDEEFLKTVLVLGTFILHGLNFLNQK